MTGDTDGASVRLAELVAALSLGVDLGFGQPMEHVLRQCLIAMRLAERVGLDDDGRADIYYTALLVNVGCHADAHEQAKWFGDDIALKSTKYDHEFGGVRGAAATFRLLGSGNPPLHRFRVALEFMLAGHRDVDGMVADHARIARLLGKQLELSPAVLAALAGAYEQWNGKGWPGELKGTRFRWRQGSPSSRSTPRSRTASVESTRQRSLRSGVPASSSIRPSSRCCAPTPS